MYHRLPNLPLLLGVVLCALLGIVALAGPVFAPRDPMEITHQIQINGTFYGTAPISRAIPPFTSADFPLGTDSDMRDVWSRLLWAVRPTLLLCLMIVAGRIAAGIVLGLCASWFGGVLAWAVESLISVSVALPALVFAVGAILAFGLQNGLWTFVVALMLTGWIDTAILVHNRSDATLRTPFVESAHAIGVSTAGVFWRHVLPQIWPLLPMLIAFEMSAVLLLLAELGYLGYYVGGGYMYTFSLSGLDTQYVRTSGYPELGQMLSRFFEQLYQTPWVSVSAGIVVFLALAGFSLLGEGLRRKLR